MTWIITRVARALVLVIIMLKNFTCGRGSCYIYIYFFPLINSILCKTLLVDADSVFLLTEEDLRFKGQSIVPLNKPNCSLSRNI